MEAQALFRPSSLRTLQAQALCPPAWDTFAMSPNIAFAASTSEGDGNHHKTVVFAASVSAGGGTQCALERKTTPNDK